jgi:hypothetical protein
MSVIPVPQIFTHLDTGFLDIAQILRDQRYRVPEQTKNLAIDRIVELLRDLRATAAELGLDSMTGDSIAAKVAAEEVALANSPFARPAASQAVAAVVAATAAPTSGMSAPAPMATVVAAVQPLAHEAVAMSTAEAMEAAGIPRSDRNAPARSNQGGQHARH